MAFSTQKDFFHVPFMNETVQYECKRACVNLKSYDSNIDDRSWARDETKRSKFLSDLVTCQFPTRETGGDGDDRIQRQPAVVGTGGMPGRSASFTGTRPVNAGTRAGGNAGPSAGFAGTSTGFAGTSSGGNAGGASAGTAASRHNVENANAERSNAAKGNNVDGAFVAGDTLLGQLGAEGVLTGGDSLLQCANVHLAEYQKIMNIKDSLEKQLDVSNERLKTANQEIHKIKEILTTKLDSNTTKDFHNKIQKFISAGKFTKNEENEMLQIHQKMENMHKGYEALQAENNYLRRLIEKLSARVTIDQIKQDPEKSTNVQYLQNEVNTLRKECTLLRSMEDDYQKIKQNTGKRSGLTDQDAENIKAIVKDRNALREKCRSFKALEKTVVELEQKYKETDKMNVDMSSSLHSQASHIKNMECEMQKMQKYYEEQLEQARFMEQCLKAQVEDLKDDIVNYKCKAQKADILQTEVACLRNEVLRRDMALSDYDCQYKQLMDVVNELQAMKLQCLQDNHTQTCKNQTDDLAFFTCATLDEIMKEMKKKGCVKPEYDSEYYAYGLEPRDEEFTRLQHETEAMKKERDNMCADALKRIQELENENARLVGVLKDGEEKMSNMLKKIERLDSELNRNGDELRRSSNELNEARKLVEDISNIQLQNQKLANAVGAINSRDDEKIIDDLRRQLQEELDKLKKCQLEKLGLEKQAEERDNELKSLKELTNKLRKDIRTLEQDNKTLLQDKEDLMKYKTGEGGDDGIDKLKKGNSDDHVDQNIKDKYKNKKDTDTDDDHIDENDKNVNDKKEKVQKISGINDDFVHRKPDEARALDDNSVNKRQIQATALDDNSLDYDTVNKSLTQATALDYDSVNKNQTQATALDYDSVNKNQTQATALRPTSKTKADGKVFDEFVNKNAENLKITLNKGRCMERELRKILEEYALECGFRGLSGLVNPKSKFYTICHKLCHSGISTLSFRELAYLHKKIYTQAEKLLPGCLLDMILSDHKEEAQSVLNTCLTLPQTIEGMGGEQKCCCCKNELCCNKSEEILKEKVTKLEKDIEIARDYLESLKTLPLGNNSSHSDFGEIMDTNECPTYRPASPTPKVSTKQLKKLKSRLLKNPEIYRSYQA